MDITVFLAQIWGPVILAGGIGVFTSRNHYLRIYRELGKEAFAVLLFGMTVLAAGIIHIKVHNFPRIADRAGDWWVSTNHS